MMHDAMASSQGRGDDTIMNKLRTIQAVAMLAASYAAVAMLGVVALTVVGIATVATMPFRPRSA